MQVGRQVGRYACMYVCTCVCMYVCMYVCRALSSLFVLSSTRFHLIFQRSTSSTKSLYKVLNNLSTHCLLLALIHRPLNYPRFPRRQGIGIFSSSQMGCLQDHSRSVHLYYIHYVYLNMEHIYMRIPVRKWSIDLKKFFFCQIYAKARVFLSLTQLHVRHCMVHQTKKNTTQYVFDTTIYTQTNTNNVNKICALIQPTGNKRRTEHRFNADVVTDIGTQNENTGIVLTMTTCWSSTKRTLSSSH